jgi:hypothetical protein
MASDRGGEKTKPLQLQGFFVECCEIWSLMLGERAFGTDRPMQLLIQSPDAELQLPKVVGTRASTPPRLASLARSGSAQATKKTVTPPIWGRCFFTAHISILPWTCQDLK